MPVAVDDLKRSLRLADDDVDAGQVQQLESYLNAAKSFVHEAVGADDDFYNSPENEDLYKTVVLALATAYYQNPSALTTGQVNRVDLVCNNIIVTLSLRLLEKKEASKNGSNS